MKVIYIISLISLLFLIAGCVPGENRTYKSEKTELIKIDMSNKSNDVLVLTKDGINKILYIDIRFKVNASYPSTPMVEIFYRNGGFKYPIIDSAIIYCRDLKSLPLLRDVEQN